MRVDGQCIEANSSNCPKIYVSNSSGQFCVDCDADQGLLLVGGQCICDSNKYLSRAENGSCAKCKEQQLVYDEIIGECYCDGGMNMTFVDGNPQCEQSCPSGVFSYENPRICLSSCPSYMVLYNQSSHLRCGTCDGYMYYNGISSKTSCVDYFTCMKLGMTPQIVYEDNRNMRVCAEGAF